jgi:hypothetical protein
MEKNTISVIKRHIKENKGLNNSELARLMVKHSKLGLSEGSLKNYIAQVKAMKPKTVSTKKGHISSTIEPAKSLKGEKIGKIKVIKAKSPIYSLIEVYLIANPEMNNSEIVRLMHSKGDGTLYTEGTLKNYVSAARSNSGSSSTSSKSSAPAKMINHEVFIVDTNAMDDGSLQNIIDNLSSDLDNKISVLAFDENIQSIAKFESNPEINFRSENQLGINLLGAISTATLLFIKNNSVKDIPTNMTIITSGGDNLSTYLAYPDVRALLDELKEDFNVSVNLVFTGEREDEAIPLGIYLGIDSTNVTVDASDDNLIEALQKRAKFLLKKTPIIAAFYYN